MPVSRVRGFTLIEIMITVAILAIVASVALPSYSAYVQRSRVPAALDTLSVIAAKMEMVYQDLNDGTYGTVGQPCKVAITQPSDFSVTCSIPAAGSFVARATGSGRMAGYEYTIDQTGTRKTTSHPKGGNNTCWTTKGSVCDT